VPSCSGTSIASSLLPALQVLYYQPCKFSITSIASSLLPTLQVYSLFDNARVCPTSATCLIRRSFERRAPIGTLAVFDISATRRRVLDHPISNDDWHAICVACCHEAGSAEQRSTEPQAYHQCGDQRFQRLLVYPLLMTDGEQHADYAVHCQEAGSGNQRSMEPQADHRHDAHYHKSHNQYVNLRVMIWAMIGTTHMYGELELFIQLLQESNFLRHVNLHDRGSHMCCAPVSGRR